MHRAASPGARDEMQVTDGRLARLLQESEIAMREVRLLQMARQQNIVHLLEAYRSQSGRLYLVFEYVDRTLLQLLKTTNKQGLPVGIVKSVTYQLLLALSYLHRKKASRHPPHARAPAGRRVGGGRPRRALRLPAWHPHRRGRAQAGTRASHGVLCTDRALSVARAVPFVA